MTDDLITRGHNYSLAVAVTDSTGQHGLWSDQFTFTYHGMNSISCVRLFFKWCLFDAVPGIVSFIVQLQQTHINVIWQVRLI